MNIRRTWLTAAILLGGALPATAFAQTADGNSRTKLPKPEIYRSWSELAANPQTTGAKWVLNLNNSNAKHNCTVTKVTDVAVLCAGKLGGGGMGDPQGQGDWVAAAHDWNYEANGIGFGSHFKPFLSRDKTLALIESNEQLFTNAGGIQGGKMAALFLPLNILETVSLLWKWHK